MMEQEVESPKEEEEEAAAADDEEVLESPPDSPDLSTPSPRLPSLRSSSDSTSTPPVVTPSSTLLGNLSAARRPGPPPMSSAASIKTGGLPQDMQAKLKAFHLSRQGAPPNSSLRIPAGPGPHALSSSNLSGVPRPVPGGIAAGNPSSPLASRGPALNALNASKLTPPGRPHVLNWSSAPVVAGAGRLPKPGLGARRGLNLPGGLPGALGPPSSGASGLNASHSGAADGGGATDCPAGNAGLIETGSLFNKFSDYVDTKAGTLKFAGKAVIHGKGIDFSSGSSFSISLDEVENLEELGKGNYGTVYRVRHSRPQMRRPGLGLKGNMRLPSLSVSAASSPATRLGQGQFDSTSSDDARADSSPESAKPPPPPGAASTTGIIMAMKEIHLELDEAKFAAIIMELDVLHRCTSPFIVDFYGAFFQEGAVYICMEYMDGGSIDKLYGDGIPETVLRKVALSTVMGLKTLKDDHNIIHRDVKPTNILVNTKGQVKICDFGVSGNLVASIAKTNIGCQSYMAPERIASGGVAQAGANPGGGTYSVQSDIWSLGLTIIECAMGRYPYAPETYNNIFSQLSAIVDGEPPDLPEEGFSPAARDFVRGCLNKIPKLRPTYAMLLRHPWLADLLKPPAILESDEGAEELLVTDSGAAFGLNGGDEDVARWAREALERRAKGTMGKKDKPALHAAPLDASAQPR